MRLSNQSCATHPCYRRQLWPRNHGFTPFPHQRRLIRPIPTPSSGRHQPSRETLNRFTSSCYTPRRLRRIRLQHQAWPGMPSTPFIAIASTCVPAEHAHLCKTLYHAGLTSDLRPSCNSSAPNPVPKLMPISSSVSRSAATSLEAAAKKATPTSYRALHRLHAHHLAAPQTHAASRQPHLRSRFVEPNESAPSRNGATPKPISKAATPSGPSTTASRSLIQFRNAANYYAPNREELPGCHSASHPPHPGEG